MAGQGWKQFVPGEVLKAVDFNGYAVDQSVQVYAGTAARGSALGTAVSEGMVSYIGGGTLEVYAGTATGWTTIGGGAATGFETNFLLMGA